MGACPSRARTPDPQAEEPERPRAKSKAKLHWIQAVEYISRILRLRQKWSKVGKHLQNPRVKAVSAGLTRVKGKLIRTQTYITR
jgi:hypothetical protein